MASGTEAGQDKQAGQKNIFLKKNVERPAVPGNAQYACHAEKNAEKLSRRQLFFKQKHTGQGKEYGLGRLGHNVAVGRAVGERIVLC